MINFYAYGEEMRKEKNRTNRRTVSYPSTGGFSRLSATAAHSPAVYGVLGFRDDRQGRFNVLVSRWLKPQ